MFPIFERCHHSNEAETNKKLSTNHLGPLKKKFSLYFKDVDILNLTGLQTHLPLTSPD